MNEKILYLLAVLLPIFASAALAAGELSDIDNYRQYNPNF